jgi:hypothetical protein
MVPVNDRIEIDRGFHPIQFFHLHRRSTYLYFP